MNSASQLEEGLFHAAARLTAGERAAFLDRECRGDPVLRQRLEALLAAHDATDSFMADATQDTRSVLDGELPEAADEGVGRAGKRGS